MRYLICSTDEKAWSKVDYVWNQCLAGYAQLYRILPGNISSNVGSLTRLRAERLNSKLNDFYRCHWSRINGGFYGINRHGGVDSRIRQSGSFHLLGTSLRPAARKQ